MLARIVEKQRIYGNISAINLQGMPFASALPQPPVSQLGRSHLDQALKTRDFAIRGIRHRAGLRQARHSFRLPGYRPRRGAGSGFRLHKPRLSQHPGCQNPTAGWGYAHHHRSRGTILARYPQEHWVGKRLPGVEIIKIVLAKGEGIAEALGVDGGPCLFAFYSLGEGSHDLLVYAGVPLKTGYARVNRVLTRYFLALGGAGLLALIAVWMLGQFFLIGRTRDPGPDLPGNLPAATWRCVPVCPTMTANSVNWPSSLTKWLPPSNSARRAYGYRKRNTAPWWSNCPRLSSR